MQHAVQQEQGRLCFNGMQISPGLYFLGQLDLALPNETTEALD
ncbi:MAG: hypothetical protein RLZZ601_1270 [Pseudomonadota bacterium]|jgi:hypothetical protein